MRILQSQGLIAASAIAFLAGCSGSAITSIAPQSASLQHAARHFTSFYACPAKGPIKYVSDFNNDVVDVFAGKFSGQAPCGQITSVLKSPWGIFVEPRTHDLYVANYAAHDIVVFHRGQMAPYNTYTDPTFQDPVDVAVAKDGTVIASNQVRPHFPTVGSLSTWVGGPNGGTFVGNFTMSPGSEGLYLTVQRDGTVYFDDLVSTQFNFGALWSVSCPAGACGTQTQVSGVSFNSAGGVASDDTEDVLAINGAGFAETFELPNPNPKSIPLSGVPVGMAINALDHHLFVTDAANNDAAEYSYPDGKLIGTVPGNAGGGLFGIAVDPGHAR
jgi:DNA-binding beta-propeller fold protein YncE